MIIVRLICYLSLAVVVFGFGLMIFLNVSGLCPTLGSGVLQCTTDFAKSLAELAILIVYGAVFLIGLPALGGVGFAIHDIFFKKRK